MVAHVHNPPHCLPARQLKRFIPRKYRPLLKGLYLRTHREGGDTGPPRCLARRVMLGRFPRANCHLMHSVYLG
jgi:hypothetical protein